jgi:hypothetical protein
MNEHQQDEPPLPQPVDEHQRKQIRRWRRELAAAGFTDQQAARLVLAKFLYLRGRLEG